MRHTDRFSACTYPLIHLPLEETLRAVAAAGIAKVDLLGRAAHFSLNPDEFNVQSALTLCKQTGVCVGNLSSYGGAGFMSENQQEAEQELLALKQTLDLAEALGARSIRVLRYGKQFDNPANLERAIPWLKQLAAHAAAKKIYMGVENHGGEINGNPARSKRMFEQVDSPYFGLLYDPCNYFTYGEDYKRAFEVLKDHIVHVHLKDARRTAEGTALTMLGEGEIDFVWVLQQLQRFGYTGDYALEYELTTEPAESALKKWKDALQSICKRC